MTDSISLARQSQNSFLSRSRKREVAREERFDKAADNVAQIAPGQDVYRRQYGKVGDKVVPLQSLSTGATAVGSSVAIINVDGAGYFTARGVD